VDPARDKCKKLKQKAIGEFIVTIKNFKKHLA
jgi:hypothetical protein